MESGLGMAKEVEGAVVVVVSKKVNVSLVFTNTGFGGRDDSDRTEASDSDLSSRTKFLGEGREAET